MPPNVAHFCKMQKNIAFINMELVFHKLAAAAGSVASEIPARCRMFDFHGNAETSKDECKLPVKRTHPSFNLCPGWVQRRPTGLESPTEIKGKSRLPLPGKSPGTLGPSTLWLRSTRHLDSTLASA